MHYLPVYLVALLQLFQKEKKTSWIQLFFILILVLFAAFRYGIGTDYESYVFIYENLLDNVEKGFYLLNLIVKKLNMGVVTVFFVSSGIILLNINKGIKLCKVDTGIALYLYFCLYYLSQNFNVVRHGIAASFVFVAMGYMKNKEFKLSVLNIILGSLFHTISLVCLPFILFARMNFRKAHYIVMLLLGIIFARLDIVNYMISFLNAYFSNLKFVSSINYYLYDYALNIGVSALDYAISVGFLARMLILIIILLFPRYHEKRMYESNILFFAIIMSLILSKYGVFAERIVNILYMSEIILLADIKSIFSNDKFTKIILNTTIILYGSMFFVKILLMRAGTGNYQYIPYQSIF